MVDVLLMCLILCIAGALQGVSGFGFGLLSVGLLALIWPDPKMATVLPVLPNLGICTYALYRHRHHLPWRRVTPFVVASVAGIPIGVWMLQSIDMTSLRLGIGGLLVVSAVYGYLPYVGQRRWHRLFAGLPLGLASGVLGGAFNTGGPPAIAYMSNQQLTRFAVVSGLQVVFLLGGSVRLVCLLGADMLPARIAALSALGVVTAVIGIALGTKLLGRLSDAVVTHAIRIAQLALGGVYFAQAAAASAA